MNEKKKIAVSLYLISMLQMAGMGVSPILSNLAEAFPDTPISKIQLIMTLPALFIIVFALLSAALSHIFSKKFFVIISTVLILISGTGAFFLHGSVEILLVWAGVLGSGIGLFGPVVSSILADHFDEHEKVSITGLLSSFATGGGVLLTLAGGLLARLGWHYTYAIYLLAVPALLAGIFWIPGDHHKAEKKKGSKLNGKVWYCAVIVFLFVCISNNLPANLSVFLAETNIGDAAFAGTAISIYMIGGVIGGFLFKYVFKIFGKQLFTFAFLTQVICFAGLSFTTNLAVLFVCIITGGIGISLTIANSIFNITLFEKPENMVLAMTVPMIAASLGQFVTPAFTMGSTAIMKSDTTKSRFLFIAVFAAVIAVFLLIKNTGMAAGEKTEQANASTEG